ncbi:MAG: dihydropteroate synthase, partial [Alphaproteobacteria bacterium]|nr:dihydropteroate synthase [Alphaproteobacteria bacterium]
MHTRHTIALPSRAPLILGQRPLVMGILNVTPDSFSDGGRHAGVELARAHARQM